MKESWSCSACQFGHTSAIRSLTLSATKRTHVFWPCNCISHSTSLHNSLKANASGNVLNAKKCPCNPAAINLARSGTFVIFGQPSSYLFIHPSQSDGDGEHKKIAHVIGKKGPVQYGTWSDSDSTWLALYTHFFHAKTCPLQHSLYTAPTCFICIVIMCVHFNQTNW